MATAEELLNSLSEEATTENSDVEPYIIIGEDRKITVPDSLKRIAVQYDHDIETVIFDCPRHWDEHDLSQMAIYINYMRSDGYLDSYPVTDVTSVDDRMQFSWTISRNVTEVEGPLTFLVCVKNVDSEGNESNHWNSELCSEMYVSKGMETDVQPMDLYPDIITQLLLRMDVTEGYYDEIKQLSTSAQEASDMALEQANRAEEFGLSAWNSKVDTENAASEIRNSYANAIKGKVSGAIIRMDDVSPLEHNPVVKVHGKNLLNIPDTVVEGSHAWCNTSIGSYELDPGTYTISVDFIQQGTDTSRVTISTRKYEAVTVQLAGTSSEEESGKLKLTFTIPDEEKGFTLYAYSNTTANALETSCAFSNFQIEKGKIATEYTPFIDASMVELTRCGKAIFSKSSQVVSGVEKPWTSLLVAAMPVPPGDYVVSCRFNQTGQDISTVSVSTRSYNDYTVAFGDTSSSEKSGYLEKAFTVTEGSGGFQIFLYSNVPNEALTTECSFENICVELGSVATGYEVYNGEKYTPDTDGIVSGITSLSPNMTIYTNTEGIVVECEYNRDTTKYIDNIMTAVSSGSGFVDSITGDIYTMSVSNGKLILTKMRS